MRRAAAFLLRTTIGALAVAAELLDPLDDDEGEPDQEPDDDESDTVYLEPVIGELEDEPGAAFLAATLLDVREHDLPWPERRPACINYPHEAYYAAE